MLIALFVSCVHRPTALVSNVAEVTTTNEFTPELVARPEARCESFTLDLTGTVLPPADAHAFDPEVHIYRLELNGADHAVECLLRPGCRSEPFATAAGKDEYCVDYKQCCDKGAW